ncbi:hypothetical protein CcaverHIS002_0311230 [Cutaneotrichosporon cavernicola]|uniref:SDE2-like domain-containing protein n=1 Tax=Cutaneotrichosporon cavernicola TaxID=279322 RepID=A0AA48L318_9TREE|nr:uncharacterized protein CcaverHIS019_0311090 [Cutaneotrichosporon cavernicola]BEI83255.1 hypothetical protein CcaverHIS002_0311230 [Cutaneotrichosporon cavernicola]BEI91039.1 hypothetical protein CcaverHIS019_0311090 [Cutaneotrichosporon cavernicola]BEI98818.1 hypothetical protein CcaverHIS631_0311170 [Cutaneotrichosporon cavernicola]BEJ06590.1 hypothetical protein CcaverHIS641_0311120 [Cutaneotrichosporon cavernicola]
MRVHLRLPSPLGVTALHVPATAMAGTLLPDWDAFLRTRARIVDANTPLSELSVNGLVEIEVVPRLRGGKGGFGANLRSQGGRMSASKSTNFDSCKDLNGRRLGTVKEAQKQADLIENWDEMQTKAKAEERSKLEALERKLGVSSNADVGEVDVEELARKKHKFDDSKFLEESREIKDNVRSAVGAALLKKRKKTKAPGPDGKALGVKEAAKVAQKKVGVKTASAKLAA